MYTAIHSHLVFGKGRPKIIVPLCEPKATLLLTQASALAQTEADLVEWRLDALEDVHSIAALCALFPRVQQALAGKPLLATCRSVRDGGAGPDGEGYAAVCHALCQMPGLDYLDVELSVGDAPVREWIAAAHQNGIGVILSSHDFSGTPPLSEMTARLRHMQLLGADAAKLAVMPHNRQDAATLLYATASVTEQFPETPIITMSMGPIGLISRLSCEAFGSAATFAAVGHASAPGQPSLQAARAALDAIHACLT